MVGLERLALSCASLLLLSSTQIVQGMSFFPLRKMNELQLAASLGLDADTVLRPSTQFRKVDNGDFPTEWANVKHNFSPIFFAPFTVANDVEIS